MAVGVSLMALSGCANNNLHTLTTISASPVSTLKSPTYRLKYQVDISGIDTNQQAPVMEDVKRFIEYRLNDPRIPVQTSQLGNDHFVSIELSQMNDIDAVKDLIEETALLTFKEQPLDRTENEKKANDKFRTEQMTKARTILIDAQKPGADFTTLVKENSERQNLVDNGVVDFQKEQNMDPVLWTQIKSLPKNKVVVIETNNAIYIEKVLDTKKEQQEYHTNATVTANHILISYQGAMMSDPKITRSKTEAQQLANQVKNELNNANFAAIAKKYSDDTATKDQGGSLGSFARGSMVQSFEDAAFSARKSDIVGPVETEFGFHMIQALDKAVGVKKTEDVLSIKRQEIYLKKTSDLPKDDWVDTELTGKQLAHAQAEADLSGQGFSIRLVFNTEGKALLSALTKRNIGKPIAIFLGDQLVSQPLVNDAITDGQAVIQGTFNVGQATQLAIDLNSGVLPAPIRLVETFQYPAS